MVGVTEGKVWGSTQLALRHNNVEAHSIIVKCGGYCSKHHHDHKWNRFLVLQGKLVVRIFRDDMVDETIVGVGQITDVRPGLVHQFEALEDTLAMEFYWVDLDPGDIDRHGTTGGLRCCL